MNAKSLLTSWRRIKPQLPHGCWLFIRVGDFYVLLLDDARSAAKLLDLKLTHGKYMAICRFPRNYLDFYLARAIRWGQKCAIVDGI